MHNLTQSAERAVANYLTANKPSWCVQVYKGIENIDTGDNETQESSIKQFPSILVFCETQQAVKAWRGNWNPRVEVRIMSMARDTTADQQHARANEVFDMLLTRSIAADIGASAGDMWVGKAEPSDAGHKIEDGKWVSYLMFELLSAYSTSTMVQGPYIVPEGTGQGVVTVVGPKGDKGDTGAQGPTGATGSTGATGPKGDKGDTGDSGSGSSAIGSNPTASVGTSVVNGSALTFMRSDSAPPINQNISPVWTGNHTYINGLLIGPNSHTVGAVDPTTGAQGLFALNDVASGDPDGFEIWTGAWANHSDLVNTNFSYIDFLGDTTFANLAFVHQESGTPGTASTINLWTSASEFYIKLQRGDSYLCNLWPTAPDGTSPYRFNTSDRHTSGALVEIVNADSVLSTIDANGCLHAPEAVDAVTFASPTNIDCDISNANYRTLALTGDLTITTSNRAAGRWFTLFITADGSTRNLTFPAWKVLGAALPATLAAGKSMALTVFFTGTTDASGFASCNVEV